MKKGQKLYKGYVKRCGYDPGRGYFFWIGYSRGDPFVDFVVYHNGISRLIDMPNFTYVEVVGTVSPCLGDPPHHIDLVSIRVDV